VPRDRPAPALLDGPRSLCADACSHRSSALRADTARDTTAPVLAPQQGRGLDEHKALWVTEVSNDSNPPDPRGVPILTHARWVQQTIYELWRQGASLVSWFPIRDQAPNYGATYQSGVYFYDGAPKLSQRAFAFPFVIEPAGHERFVGGRELPFPGGSPCSGAARTGDGAYSARSCARTRCSSGGRRLRGCGGDIGERSWGGRRGSYGRGEPDCARMTGACRPAKP
jgi:hypothetical protein